MCAKFGRGLKVASEKRGGTDTDKGTLLLYIVVDLYRRLAYSFSSERHSQTEENKIAKVLKWRQPDSNLGPSDLPIFSRAL